MFQVSTCTSRCLTGRIQQLCGLISRVADSISIISSSSSHLSSHLVYRKSTQETRHYFCNHTFPIEEVIRKLTLFHQLTGFVAFVFRQNRSCDLANRMFTFALWTVHYCLWKSEDLTSHRGRTTFLSCSFSSP